MVNFECNSAPLHFMDSLIEDIFKSSSDKDFVRTGSRISKVISKDVNKSAAVATFEKKNLVFQHHFGLKARQNN